jgi:hypothetical protein
MCNIHNQDTTAFHSYIRSKNYRCAVSIILLWLLVVPGYPTSLQETVAKTEWNSLMHKYKQKKKGRKITTRCLLYLFPLEILNYGLS